MSRSKALGPLAIVCAAVIWGSSFLLMKQVLDGFPVFLLLALRFSIAAVVLSIIFWKKLRLMDRAHLKGGITMGLMLFTAYTFQTYGLGGLGPLQGTTPGKNAFFTAIYCVLVPFFAWIAYHKPPERSHLAAALLCVAGVGLVSLSVPMTFVGGDVLTLVGGAFFALHIMAIDKATQKGDVVLLSLLQFATAAVLSWIAALLAGQFAVPPTPGPEGWVRLLYLALISTALAFTLQNVGQARSSPAISALFLSLEAPFGVLFSVLFGEERPTLTMYLGFALIFTAIILPNIFISKKDENEG